MRTEVLDPLEGDPPDFSPARARARRPGRRGGDARRAPGRGDPAPHAGTPRSRNIFDTQVAAGFLGFGNQEGYESLVRKVLDGEAEGQRGLHALGPRPLTPQQLEYAADDARLLLALGEELERRLEERGRLEWAREESRALEESTDERDAGALLRAAAAARPAERGGARRWRASWSSGARTRRARDGPRRRARCCPTRRSIELARRDARATARPRADPRPARRRRSTGAATQLLAAIERGRARAAPPRAARARPRATRPTRRSSRSPRRWCATARWSRAWRWS